jgi:predicted nucleotidyltransferase
MNWDNILEGDLRDTLDALQEVFKVMGIDYYLIGAVAREIWYVRAKKSFRKTKDIDFAVLVGNHQQYEELRTFLKDRKGFQDTKSNSFVLITPSGLQVDILPFGGIEMDNGVHVEGVGLTYINVNGFMEVYTEGTESVMIETGHQFNVATLPSIVLLKLIAFDDRPELRTKDARDIANLINNYFDLQADFIYEYHADLFSMDNEELAEQSLEEISANVIGRELKKITGKNSVLLERIKGIIEKNLSQEGPQSLFVSQMVKETNLTASVMIKWLRKMLMGLE